jgi:hypothetical protein
VNTPWKYRKYMVLTDMVLIPEALVRVITLRKINPDWSNKVTMWALKSIARIKREGK